MQEQLKVGQYVLECKLGEGGMAQVWAERHIHLGSSAAIKFLLPRLAGDPSLEDRFLNEEKRQARLEHPNIDLAIDFIQVGITFEAAGFSSAIPVGDDGTKEGRKKNRRVEVWVR